MEIWWLTCPRLDGDRDEQPVTVMHSITEAGSVFVNSQSGGRRCCIHWALNKWAQKHFRNVKSRLQKCVGHVICTRTHCYQWIQIKNKVKIISPLFAQMHCSSSLHWCHLALSQHRVSVELRAKGPQACDCSAVAWTGDLLIMGTETNCPPLICLCVCV